MDVLWPVLIIGLVAIVIGGVIISARHRLALGIAEGQRATFGPVGDKVASQSKPSGVLIAGIGFIVIGVLGIIGAVAFPGSF